MQDYIISIINNFGYAGIFLLITIENIFPPIPSEVILTFGGFMTTCTSLNVWGVTAASTAGSLLGAVLLFYIGRLLNAERLEAIVAGKLGRVLRLKTADIKKAEDWFKKRGGRAVFFCRFVPIVRSLISIPAGSSGMKFYPFIALTAAGSFIWNIALILLGRAAGEAWERIAGYFDTYTLIALVIFAASAMVFAFVFIKRRFLTSRGEGKEE